MGGEQSRPRVLGTFNLRNVNLKRARRLVYFNFFLSLHHPNNRFEISFLFVVLQHSSTAPTHVTILRYKKYRNEICLQLTTPQFTPMANSRHKQKHVAWAALNDYNRLTILFE